LAIDRHPSRPARRHLGSCGWQRLPTWPASRDPPASTPNLACAGTWPGAPGRAWTRWRRSDQTWSCTSGGCRRSAGSSLPPCPGVSRSRPGSPGPASSTASWSTRPPGTCTARRCPPNHRPRGSPACSPGPLLTAARQSPDRCGFAPAAMPGLLGLRIFEATGAASPTSATSRATESCAYLERAPRWSWCRPRQPSTGQ